MSAYLLTCACGKTVPVEIGQAGGRVTCSCGTQLDVPPLRQLRQLPSPTVEEKQSASRWGTRQGLIATGLIVAAALLGWGAWTWWTEPVVPKVDLAAHAAAVENELKTPAGAWRTWVEYYRPLAELGFPIFQVRNAAEIEGQIAHARFLRHMLWSVAGIFAAAAAAGVFWPEPAVVKTGRQGDKETRRNS